MNSEPRPAGVATVTQALSDQVLRTWIRLALHEPLVEDASLPIVARLNLAIANLSRRPVFDLADLRQLLKDARDHIEATEDKT